MSSREQLIAAADAAHESLSGGTRDVVRFWVPGRIEVLGKHTDYAGGRSLLCAVDRGFCVTASRRTDDRVNVVSAGTGERVTVSHDEGDAAPRGHWSAYVKAVVRRLARDLSIRTGADIAFASNLPIAAGVSSSSALVTAMYLAIAAVTELEEEPSGDVLAGYLGAVENGLPFGAFGGDRGVGTLGGSEDHTAILRSRPGALVQYRFCPVHFEQEVPLPEHYRFIIASSGIQAEKTGAALEAYNNLSLLSKRALERWNAMSGHDHSTLGQAIADHGEEVVRVLRADSPDLAERAEQFFVESECIIPDSSRALAAGDLASFGSLVDRSMENATRMLHNQVPETVYLARRARELGAVAASAFGAGFGGSVWAMAADAEAPHICERLRADYAAEFPQHRSAAEFFVTTAGSAAHRLE